MDYIVLLYEKMLYLQPRLQLYRFYWVAVVKPGRVLFEIEYSERDVALHALELAAQKLPVKVKIIEKQDKKMKLNEMREKTIEELKKPIWKIFDYLLG